MERMASLESLAHRVMPEVMPCPKSMVLDALQILAVEFFRESGAWTATFQEEADGCGTTIVLPIPKGAALVGVNAVYLNGSLLEKGEWQECGREITLNAEPGGNAQLLIRASLRPLRTATELPCDLLEEYGDALVFGALARLKSMSGQFVEWSDQQGAGIYYQLYQEEACRAKARKYRKRRGGVLYVDTGEL